MKTKIIEEGKIKLKIPVTKLPEHGLVFYNPEMTLNRDISVAVLQTYQKIRKMKLDVCDLLSATGIRALRYKKEVRGLKRVVANDIDPKTAKFLSENAKLNRLKPQIETKDASQLLAENRKSFDFIDIDPFGPPVYFLEVAARALKKEAIIACTATDTAALFGVYPKVAFRKYGVKSIRNECMKELGTRIMITAIVRSLARFAIGFTPVLAHATRHYVRVYGTTKRAKTHADGVLENLKYLSDCKCGHREWGIREICPSCQNKMQTVGPLWSGPIQDKNFCQKVFDELYDHDYLQQQNNAMKLLKLLINEADAPEFYHDVHWLARKNKWKRLPSLEEIIEKLHAAGFVATRTHFAPTALKTDAGAAGIQKIVEME